MLKLMAQDCIGHQFLSKPMIVTGEDYRASITPALIFSIMVIAESIFYLALIPFSAINFLLPLVR
jgi:hypothetical protein